MTDADTCFWRSRRVALATGLLSLFLFVAAPAVAGLKVDYISFWPLPAFAAFFAIFIPYARWRKMVRMQGALEASSLTLLFSVPILVLTYCAMRPGLPLADEVLARADMVLGVHTPDIVHWVDRHPMLSILLGYAYDSFSAQLLLLPVLLALCGHGAAAYRMATGYLILCVFSSLLAIGFPSVGAFGHFGLTQADLQHVNAHFGYHFATSFTSVRTDPDFVLSLGVASGIVTFPSVHAGVAVICAWAGWNLPLARWPILFLNIAMFASAMTHGAHYVIDLVAGGIVAAATIMLVRWLTRPRSVDVGGFALSPPAAPATAGAAHSA